MKSKLILIILSVLSCSIQGQNLMPDLVSSSGGLHSGQNASLSWTLGEVSIKTFQTDDLMLTQGFQQPKLHTISTYNPESIVRATIYPNPAKDIININIKYPESTVNSMSIIDIKGNILKCIPAQKSKRVDISGLKPGYYFIMINTNRGIELTGIKFLKLK